MDVPVRDIPSRIKSSLIAATYKAERPAQGQEAVTFAAGDLLREAQEHLIYAKAPSPGSELQREDVTASYDAATMGMMLLRDQQKHKLEYTTPEDLKAAIGHAQTGRELLLQHVGRVTGKPGKMSEQMRADSLAAHDAFEKAENVLFGRPQPVPGESASRAS